MTRPLAIDGGGVGIVEVSVLVDVDAHVAFEVRVWIKCDTNLDVDAVVKHHADVNIDGVISSLCCVG